MSVRAEYAQAVRAAALAVCAFADLSTNALTIGETAQAVALAYDWINGELSEDERVTIRRALVRCALEPGLKTYAALEWWVDTYVNWAPVAHGGSVAAASAIADEEPAWARAVLPRVRAWLPAALASFDPDGAWCEGPAYWSYAIDYAAMLLSSLDSALGADFGLGDRSGLRDTGLYPIHAVGPSERWASYRDVRGNRSPTAISPRGHRATVPALLWLARRYDRPEYAHEELRLLRDEPAQALDCGGTIRCRVAVGAGVGDLRVAILLAPRWPDGECPPPPVRPLSAWGRA